VRVIRRVAEGESNILTRVRTLLWLVTFAALLAAALAVGASAAASVIERRTEIGLMKAAGCELGLVGCCWPQNSCCWRLWEAEFGYALGIVWRACLAKRIFGFAPAPKLLYCWIILG